MGTDNKRRAERVGRTFFLTRLLSLDQLRSSFPLRLALGGLLLVITGFVLNTGVWAALLVIWGTAILLVGLVSHLYIQLSYRGSNF